MNLNCHLICPKQFVLEIFSNFNEKPKSSKLRLKYEQMYLRELVNSHPYLCWCPGKDCSIVVYCMANKGYRVICTQCQSSFWYINFYLINFPWLTGHQSFFIFLTILKLLIDIIFLLKCTQNF